MKPVEEKIAKVSRRRSCRMSDATEDEDAGRHFRRKTQMTHVGHMSSLAISRFSGDCL